MRILRFLIICSIMMSSILANGCNCRPPELSIENYYLRFDIVDTASYESINWEVLSDQNNSVSIFIFNPQGTEIYTESGLPNRTLNYSLEDILKPYTDEGVYEVKLHTTDSSGEILEQTKYFTVFNSNPQYAEYQKYIIITGERNVISNGYITSISRNLYFVDGRYEHPNDDTRNLSFNAKYLQPIKISWFRGPYTEWPECEPSLKIKVSMDSPSITIDEYNYENWPFSETEGQMILSSDWSSCPLSEEGLAKIFFVLVVVFENEAN